MFLRLILPLRVPLNAALNRIVSHITGMYKSPLRQKKRAVLIPWRTLRRSAAGQRSGSILH